MSLDVPRCRFGRSLRLQRSGDFRRLKVEGRRSVYRRFVANWQVLPPGSRSRLGVVASRRFGNAVQRNRARRLLREVFRQAQHCFRRPVDLVLVARAPLAGQMQADMENEFRRFLKEAALDRVSG